jgi:small subunit ribosomal protein S18
MTTKNRFSKNKYDKLPVRKACLICKIDSIDYKNVGLLKKYISDRGKIESAVRTGTCSKCQRNLTVAIKRARHMAFLPIAAEHVLNTKVVVYKQEKFEKEENKVTKESEPEVKEEVKVESKESEPEVKEEVKVESKESEPDAKEEVKVESKESEPEVKEEVKVESKESEPEVKEEVKAESKESEPEVKEESK